MRCWLLSALLALALVSPALAGNRVDLNDYYEDATFSGMVGWPTIGAWVRRGSAGNLDYLSVIRMDQTAANPWRILIHNSGANWTVRAEYSGFKDHPTTFSDQEWHHVAARWTSGGVTSVFLDGVKSDGANGVVFRTPNRIQIGFREGATAGTWFVAHAFVWQWNLSDREIEAMANGLPPHLVRQRAIGANAGLEEYWPMTPGEGGGNLTSMVSINGNVLSPQGAPLAADSPPIHWPRPHYSHADTDRARLPALWAADYAYRRKRHAA